MFESQLTRPSNRAQPRAASGTLDRDAGSQEALRRAQVSSF